MSSLISGQCIVLSTDIEKLEKFNDIGNYIEEVFPTSDEEAEHDLKEFGLTPKPVKKITFQNIENDTAPEVPITIYNIGTVQNLVQIAKENSIAYLKNIAKELTNFANEIEKEKNDKKVVNDLEQGWPFRSGGISLITSPYIFLTPNETATNMWEVPHLFQSYKPTKTLYAFMVFWHSYDIFPDGKSFNCNN